MPFIPTRPFAPEHNFSAEETPLSESGLVIDLIHPFMHEQGMDVRRIGQ